MKSRVVFYLVFICIGFSLIILRLFYWQIIRGKELSSLARIQYQKNTTQGASRGSIIADDGSWLVSNTTVYELYSEPQKMQNMTSESSTRIAEIILSEETFEDDVEKTQLLKIETKRIDSALAKNNLHWVSLAKKITKSQKEEIERLNIEGLGFEEISSRIYPEGSMAAQLVGFVGKNENGEDLGYFGLEGYYDLVLSGKPGVVSREKDASGKILAIGDFVASGAINGADLVTSIDKFVQITIEKKLANATQKYGAIAGSVIVMNPENGQILAMASTPTFDPGSYQKYSNSLFRNPIVSDTFEPGSIFKVLVMAAGLDAKAVKPDTICEICSEAYRIDKYTIRTWNNQYHPGASMYDVIINSDNVGMIFVANKLGKSRFFDYMTKFGLGRPTGVDLQGEASPKLREKDKWGDVDLAIASFGQGIAVTPIQMITAVSAIANDGLLVRPSVVSKIRGSNWERDFSTSFETTKILSKEAADQVTLMMVEAAKSGESKWTHKEGFGVAGKTGTAQIAIGGNYDESKTIASFIGFAPYDKPKFLMLVTLSEPSSSPWASETAAPLWYDIASELFTYYGMQPKY